MTFSPLNGGTGTFWLSRVPLGHKMALISRETIFDAKNDFEAQPIGMRAKIFRPVGFPFFDICKEGLASYIKGFL